MLNNPLGLTATHLRDHSGNLLHIPYRVPSHGLVLFSPLADLALVVLPISAIEDPKFMGWLSLRGIYAVEDVHSTVARVGEGRVLHRVRRHRLAPVLIPSRVNAAFGLSEEWGYSTRRYMEARLAAAWTAEGNTLATTVFNWKILDEQPDLRAQLDVKSAALQGLLMISNRILDNDADEFTELAPGHGLSWPIPPGIRETPEETVEPLVGEAKLVQTRRNASARVYPHGCRLRYEDGHICAIASVRRDVVLLHPGSTVYRATGRQAGRNFRKSHEKFLAVARVSGREEVGTTQVTVVADSAAYLLKNVTGGRVHSAHRWQII